MRPRNSAQPLCHVIGDLWYITFLKCPVKEPPEIKLKRLIPLAAGRWMPHCNGASVLFYLRWHISYCTNLNLSWGNWQKPRGQGWTKFGQDGLRWNSACLPRVPFEILSWNKDSVLYRHTCIRMLSVVLMESKLARACWVQILEGRRTHAQCPWNWKIAGQDYLCRYAFSQHWNTRANTPPA